MPKTDRTSLGAPASGQIVYVQGTKTNGLAVASLVLGLVWLCGIGSLLAVIFGHVALGQIKRSEGRESGRGLAIAGAILGWIGVGLFTIGLIINATASN